MPDLSQLATEARAGDRVALDSLVRRLQTDVWRFCVHLTHSDEADDLAQESLLRIVSNLHRWERGPVKSWALGVTRNVCLEHLRKRSRRRTDPTADAGQFEHAPDRHGLAETAHLLSLLPHDQREAIVLTQILGLSYSEAADIVGCPIGTIRSRVARGRDDLSVAIGTARRRASG